MNRVSSLMIKLNFVSIIAKFLILIIVLSFRRINHLKLKTICIDPLSTSRCTSRGEQKQNNLITKLILSPLKHLKEKDNAQRVQTISLHLLVSGTQRSRPKRTLSEFPQISTHLLDSRIWPCFSRSHISTTKAFKSKSSIHLHEIATKFLKTIAIKIYTNQERTFST